MTHPAENHMRIRQTGPAAEPAPDGTLPEELRARIAVDVAGGDAPLGERVAGALNAARLYADTEVLLCGDQAQVEQEIRKLDDKPDNVTLIHAPEKIGMHESPVRALREKSKSAIVVGVEMVAHGKADAFVSAGNTGAVAAASMLKLGRLKGVQRPGIAATMQLIDHPVVAIDVGANVDCKPMHLLHYAIMASVFTRAILSVDNPRVGLLNVGEEAGKGNELTRQAYALLSDADLNFVGNVEPNVLFHHGCDIVVCDGFIGNVLLKLGESLTMKVVEWMREEVRGKLRYMLGFALCKGLFQHLRHCADSSEYGGAPLLGVRGVIIITHGTSDARAIQNAVREARGFVRHKVNAHMEAAIQAASRQVRC